MNCTDRSNRNRWRRGAPRVVIAIACLVMTARVRADAPSDQSEPRDWSPTVKIDSNIVPEVSGVAASRKYPGVYWAHSDSGNAPKLAAFDASGRCLCEIIVVAAPNIDWEDICADNAGNLYIGDIGNNTGLLPIRYIYRVPEPDPYHPPEKPVTPDHHWRVRYGDVDRVNCEALFWRDDTLYIIAREATRDCRVFKLTPTSEKDLTLELITTLNMRGVSAADASADGSTLLACSPVAARLYALRDDASLVEKDTARRISFPLIGTVEACCFFGNEIVLITESGDDHRVTLADFDQQTRFRPPARR